MVALICMVGNDYQRIIDGINYWKEVEKIDTVFLLFDEKKDKYGFASQINTNELAKTLPLSSKNSIAISYNPQSYESVFCALYNILRKEVEVNRRKVLIDSTSTTKEAYGATVTISLMFKNVRIYIVPPQERGWYVPSPEDPNFREWFSRTRSVRGDIPQEIYLPGQRLEQPNYDEKTALLKLHENGGSSDTLRSIIMWCNCNPIDPVTKNRFSRLINRLENKGLVEKRPMGKETEVHLTHFGKILSKSIKEYEEKNKKQTPYHKITKRRNKIKKRKKDTSNS